MPRLLTLIPCVSASVDPFNGNLSLLVLVESVTPSRLERDQSGPKDENWPRDAYYVLPSFAILTSWWQEAGDEGQTFRQRLVLRAPDGRETQIQQDTAFAPQNRVHRVVHYTDQIPLRTPGDYFLVVKLRAEADAEWRIAGEHPIFVIG
jgi:hypothetical protein